MAQGSEAVARFLRPRSIAIVGISSRIGSAGQAMLQSLKLNDFSGEIYLVGRSSQLIDGRIVLARADDLPEGLDLAIFTLPAIGVQNAIYACIRRKVATIMILASGFAEIGNHSAESAFTAAREAGVAIVGPNCIGVTNNVDGLSLNMVRVLRAQQGVKNGIAFVGQSGGVLGHFHRAANGRALPVSYIISTGNESGLETADFIDFLAEDSSTGVIALYCEQIRRPDVFLSACRRARAAGKPVVIIYPGRSVRAQQATRSHTGALATDIDTMQIQVEDVGAIVATTTDEMMDLIEILARYPTPPTAGPGIITASGAYVGLINDFAQQLSLDIPRLDSKTINKIAAVLPSYGNYDNPLDVTAGYTLDALSIAIEAVVNDPNVGSLLLTLPTSSVDFTKAVTKGLQNSTKPTIIVSLGDTDPLPEAVTRILDQSSVVLSRSVDRMLRAVALYTRYGRSLTRGRAPFPFCLKKMPLSEGNQAEWIGKKFLSSAGIAVPAGGLARQLDEAVSIAERIGYPVALKAQAALLTHKTEAGGVMLNLDNEDDLRAAWATTQVKVRNAAPGVILEGCLVEKMVSDGVEVIVGAKREGAWGPVLLVGLGGTIVEAVGDVQLLPVDADRMQILAAFEKLRASKLFFGFRGLPAVDLDAAVDVVLATGSLMRAERNIIEIEINPLMVHAKGLGATALDALIVYRSS